MGYDHLSETRWHCDNMAGLSEHVTCHMFQVFALFLGSCPAQIDGQILTIYTSRVSVQGYAFWGLVDIAPHLVGRMVSKNILGYRGVNRRFQGKCAKYLHFRIIKTTAVIPTKFCKMVKTSMYFSWVVQKCDPQIQDRSLDSE